MQTGHLILNNRYFDSVFLMQIASRLSAQPGVEEAAVLMGTENNKGLLAELGFEDVDILSASANDLIIALIAENKSSIETILGNIDQWLIREPSTVDRTASRTFQGALDRQPESNLAVISVPGEYAFREAMAALEAGLNVFVFSSNVPIEEEISLKLEAKEKELIVMGPDAGTGILAGVGIGFANVVRRGKIGVIGSSGTGLQEITSLIHKADLGISHAIGTGSKDLSNKIGGISTFIALNALENDPGTEVVVLVSKPPGDEILPLLANRLNDYRKPVIVCLLGLTEFPAHLEASFSVTDTLDRAAALAIQAAGGEPKILEEAIKRDILKLIENERKQMSTRQKYIRGVFAGGTFTYQAQHVLGTGGLRVYSNTPLKGMRELTDPQISKAHTLVDMGDELFTSGRPHPMIDATLRNDRILQEADDPEVAILLLDFILGYNASPDPVGDLIEAIQEGKRKVVNRGGYLSIVASVTGTNEDPQNLKKQVNLLEEAGVIVFPSNAKATQFCLELVQGIES